MHATGLRTSRFTAQQMAVERAIAIAEFSTSAILHQANDNWLDLLGYSKAQALGQHYRSFCLQTFADQPAYDHLWQQINQGHVQTLKLPYRRNDASLVWLETTFSPVFDAQQQVCNIIAIAYACDAPIAHSVNQLEHFERLMLVAETSHTAIIISHPSKGIEYVSPGFTRLFGWQKEEVQGLFPLDLLCTTPCEIRFQKIRTQLAQGLSVQDEEMTTGKQGQRHWVTFVTNPILDASGQWALNVIVLSDITKTKTYEVLQQCALEAMVADTPLTETLEAICKEVESLAPEITASILEVDEKGLLHALASPSLPQSYIDIVEGLEVGPQSGSCGTAAWRGQSVQVDDIATDPLWANYSWAALELGFIGCWSTPLCNGLGEVIGTFAFYFKAPRNAHAVRFHQLLVDASTRLCALALEREKNRKQIRQLAFYDPLTGLPNQSLMLAKAEQSLEAARIKNEPMAVLFIDIDRFKPINDLHGHPAGNELLRQVAHHLKASLSSTDIAGRQSGDEFVAILPGHCHERIVHTVQRLQAAITQPMAIAGTHVSITASIGIAMYPANGRDIETLLHRADMAMYQAKSTGRGKYSFFNEKVSQQAQERLQMQNALQEAVLHNALHFVYQPQLNMQTGLLYGVETLARWHHPQLGEIPPSTFIPMAEENGLIATLGIAALSQACSQLQQWRLQGLEVPSISVNLSPSSFHHADIVQAIRYNIEKANLAPTDLTLEITEEILLDHSSETIRNIEAVHAMGVRISMDDFGVGYSSLSYLRKLPVSELKLDLSFVVDLEHNPTAQELSRAIRGIGVGLHLTVVAEGVETAQQFEILRTQGYDVAQGHFIAKPLSAPDFEVWMQTKFVAPPHLPAPSAHAWNGINI